MTGNVGFCRTTRRARRNLALPFFALTACLAQPALARDSQISIAAGTLDVALNALAREAQVEIVSTEPTLRTVRTPALTGRMSAREALRRLLEGSGFRAVRIENGFRIVRAPLPPPPRPRAAQRVHLPPPAPELPPPVTTGAEIVVTASKQNVPLLRYPGSLTVVDSTRDLPGSGKGDMTDAASVIPILQSTQLGPGRNKVFIRGIADSSFNGATQAPTSVYWDDVQLDYSGPDPGLRLYDVRRIEVLEGPQGTLYGSGAIGGVIRMTSNPVDLTARSVSLDGGVTATRGGSLGGDLAGILNLPVQHDRLGLRLVAYDVRDGGYIDDIYRHLRSINSAETSGGRATLRFEPGNGWHIEAGAVGQWIDMRDGQYIDRYAGPYARRSLIDQPFSNRLAFGRLVISKDWSSGLRLVSATGFVSYHSEDQFDASLFGFNGAPPFISTYTADRDKQLLSQETRLSRTLSNGNSWVAGFSVVSDRDILSRSIGSPGMEATIIGVTNVTKEASAFGETTFGLFRNFSITVGARATTARVDGEPSSTPRSGNFVRGKSTERVDPTAAANWVVAPHIALFARFQTGYRTGGLAVAPGIGRVADYEADNILVGEVGIRKTRVGPTGLSFSGSFSFASWNDIQADLVNRRGQPYTDNIGDARIQAVEGNVDWVPIRGLQIQGAFLYTHNVVYGPIADLSVQQNRRLPETPPLAAHGSVGYEWRSGAVTPRLMIAADYVGRSVLGTGDLLDLSQGNYTTVRAGAGARWRNMDLSLTVENLTNSSGNRFAFGNPFTLLFRDQATPLRPTNARLGLSVAW